MAARSAKSTKPKKNKVPKALLIRAVRVELIKPLDEPWETAGATLRLLAKTTPKLLNAAMDARIACSVAGSEAVKAAVSPDTRGSSPEALMYQAALRAIDRLREWGAKHNHPFANLEMAASIVSCIARAAAQAYARRDQEKARFSSERILVRNTDAKLLEDGSVLSVKLRPVGAIRFALAGSYGEHRALLRKMAAGEIECGDCKIQRDEERGKWYALLAYKAPPAQPVGMDPNRVLAVHRGVRNALYLVSTAGHVKSLPGGKYVAQRQALQARIKNIRQISAPERGDGAKGHGRARRFQTHDALGDKLARATRTWCQQAAAFVAQMARAWGCGTVVIEDYGGIEPAAERTLRRVLDRFPLYQLKQCITSRLEMDGILLRETPSAFISSTCPRCGHVDQAQHNTRTGIFHCKVCGWERPADLVAGLWMLRHSGADMAEWDRRFAHERRLAAAAKEAA